MEIGGSRFSGSEGEAHDLQENIDRQLKEAYNI